MKMVMLSSNPEARIVPEPGSTIEGLRRARQLWNEPCVFKEGDVIRARSGINASDSLPMCIVIRVLVAKEKKHGIRRDDLVIGYLYEGSFNLGVTDSRRYEMVPEVESSDLDQLRALLSQASGTIRDCELAPYLTGSAKMVFMYECGWTPTMDAYVKPGDSDRALRIGQGPEGFFLTAEEEEVG